jgi:hypothetical protein
MGASTSFLEYGLHSLNVTRLKCTQRSSSAEFLKVHFVVLMCTKTTFLWFNNELIGRLTLPKRFCQFFTSATRLKKHFPENLIKEGWHLSQKKPEEGY